MESSKQGGHVPNQGRGNQQPFKQPANSQYQWIEQQPGFYQDPIGMPPQQPWSDNAENQPMNYSGVEEEEDDYMDEEGELEEDYENIEDIELSKLLSQNSHVMPSASNKITISFGGGAIPRPPPVLQAPQTQLPSVIPQPMAPFEHIQKIDGNPLIQAQPNKQAFTEEQKLTTDTHQAAAPQQPSFKISIQPSHSQIQIPQPDQTTPHLQPYQIDLKSAITLQPVQMTEQPVPKSNKIVLSGITLGLAKPQRPPQVPATPNQLQQQVAESFVSTRNASPPLLPTQPIHQQEPLPNYSQQPFIDSRIDQPVAQRFQLDGVFGNSHSLVPQIQVEQPSQQFEPACQPQFSNAIPMVQQDKNLNQNADSKQPQYFPTTVSGVAQIDANMSQDPPVLHKPGLYPPGLQDHQQQATFEEPYPPKKIKAPKEKKKKRIKETGNLLEFYQVKKVKVTMEFSPEDNRARCQTIYKLALIPDDQVAARLKALKEKDIYKKYYLDVKFHAKQQCIAKVCLLKETEQPLSTPNYDQMLYIYDYEGQKDYQQKRFSKVSRRIHSYEVAQQMDYDREQNEPTLVAQKIATLNFKKDNLADQLPKTLDIMVSSFLLSIQNFGVTAVKYKIQYSRAGLSSQEGTYYHSSDNFDTQHLWLPIIQNHQNAQLLWSFKYILPKGYTIVASGKLFIKQVEQDCGDFARALFHYKISEPAPLSKLGFIIGKFGEIYKMQEVRSIPNAYGFFINSYKQQLFTANNQFVERSIVETVIDFLQKRTIGAPYPFEALKLVFVPNLFLKNQRKQSINFYGGVHIFDEELLIPKNQLEGRHRTVKHIASAIAFDYFGGKLQEESPEDFWLLQGIRESIGNQFKIMRFGNLLQRYHIMQTIASIYKKAKNGIERFPVRSLDLPNPAELMLNELIYEKSELIMHMIESMIDKSYFERIIRELYAQQIRISTQLFKKIFKEVVGFKLKQFSQNWIHSTSCPELTVSYTFNKKNNSLDLTLSQESAVKHHFLYQRYIEESRSLDELLTRPFRSKTKHYHSNESAQLKMHLEALDKMGEFSVDQRQFAQRWFEGEVNVMLYLTDGAEITPQQQKMTLKKKEAAVSINIPLNVKVKKTIQNKKKEYESMHMHEHEEEEDDDGASVEQGRQSTVIDNNQWKFGMNEFELEDYPLETKTIFDVKNLESSVLWIRVDPDMEYIRKVKVNQDTNNWLFQLLLEKDIIGQIEAIKQLYKQTQKQQFIYCVLQAVCTNENFFFKVRKIALKCLQKMQTSVFNEYLSHEKFLLKIFNQRNYDAAIGFYKSNDFTKYLEYFFDKYLLKTIAKCKESPLLIRTEVLEKVREHTKSMGPQPVAPVAEGANISIPLVSNAPTLLTKVDQTPREHLLKLSSDSIATLLLRLLQENDNSENMFDDSHYLKQIIKSLGSLDNFKCMPDIAREVLRQFKLDHIGKFSPQFAITKGAIAAFFNIKKAIYLFNNDKRPNISEQMEADLMFIDDQIKLTEEILTPMEKLIDSILQGNEKNWPLEIRYFIADYKIKHCFFFQQNPFMRALYIQLKIVDQFLADKQVRDAVAYMRHIALFLEQYLPRLDYRDALLDNPRATAIVDILWTFLTLPLGYVDCSLSFWVKKVLHILYGVHWPHCVGNQEKELMVSGQREQDQLYLDPEWAPSGGEGGADDQSKGAMKNNTRSVRAPTGYGIRKNDNGDSTGVDDMFGHASIYNPHKAQEKIKIVMKSAAPPTEEDMAQQRNTSLHFSIPLNNQGDYSRHSHGQQSSFKITINSGNPGVVDQRAKNQISIPNYNNQKMFDDGRTNNSQLNEMQYLMRGIGGTDNSAYDQNMRDESQLGDDESEYDEFAEISFPVPWKQQIWQITGELWYHVDSAAFLEPVTRLVLGGSEVTYRYYLNTIDYPMDLTTIKEKIKEDQYPNVGLWRQDVETMFKNCLTYNEPASLIYKSGEKLRNFYFNLLHETGLISQGPRIKLK